MILKTYYTRKLPSIIYWSNFLWTFDMFGVIHRKGATTHLGVSRGDQGRLLLQINSLPGGPWYSRAQNLLVQISWRPRADPSCHLVDGKNTLHVTNDSLRSGFEAVFSIMWPWPSRLGPCYRGEREDLLSWLLNMYWSKFPPGTILHDQSSFVKKEVMITHGQTAGKQRRLKSDYVVWQGFIANAHSALWTTANGIFN